MMNETELNLSGVRDHLETVCGDLTVVTKQLYELQQAVVSLQKVILSLQRERNAELEAGNKRLKSKLTLVE